MNEVDILDSLQTAAIEAEKKKQAKNNKSKYNFDKLKMFFGDDYDINGIKISMPKIGEILEIGEKIFYTAVMPFVSNSTSIRVLLYKIGKDWNKVSDIETFYFLIHTTVHDLSPLKLLFKDITFDDIKLLETGKNDDGTNQFALYSPSQNLLIYEDAYMEIAEYIREIMNQHPKVEKAKGKETKKSMIWEDEMKILNQQEKGDESNLLALISSCTNHPGFKYNLQELRDVGLYQFMDSVKRIQKYENGIAALHGGFSGFVNFKDIPEDTLNYMGDV